MAKKTRKPRKKFHAVDASSALSVIAPPCEKPDIPKGAVYIPVNAEDFSAMTTGVSDSGVPDLLSTFLEWLDLSSDAMEHVEPIRVLDVAQDMLLEKMPILGTILVHHLRLKRSYRDIAYEMDLSHMTVQRMVGSAFSYLKGYCRMSLASLVVDALAEAARPIEEAVA